MKRSANPNDPRLMTFVVMHKDGSTVTVDAHTTEVLNGYLMVLRYYPSGARCVEHNVSLADLVSCRAQLDAA